MKKILILIIAVTMSVSIFAAKIAIVNTQKVFQGYSKTQTAKAKLEKEKNKLEGQLAVKADSLTKIMKKLNAKGDNITEAEKDRFEKQETEFGKQRQALQKKLGELEYEEMRPIQAEIKSAIQQIARKNKYDMVIDGGAVLYGGEDITTEVLNALENSKKIKL